MESHFEPQRRKDAKKGAKSSQRLPLRLCGLTMIYKPSLK